MDGPHSRRSTIDIYEDDSALPTHPEDNEIFNEGIDDDDQFSEHSEGSSERLSFVQSDVDDDGQDDSFFHNEADQPFDSGAPPSDDILESIESPDSTLHSQHQSFSHTAPVHIDSHVDPQQDYVDRQDGHADCVTLYQQYESHEATRRQTSENVDDDRLVGRKVSESVSALPDELEYYRSSLPGRSPLAATKSQNESRRGTIVRGPSLQAVSPSIRSHNHSRSTPTVGHMRTNSSAVKSDYRPVFRNPSSIRALQMSSPSPPPYGISPMSGRRLRNSVIGQSDSPHHSFQGSARSFQATPTKRSSPRRASPRKEHPLVLLHCTLTFLEMPASFAPEALDAVGASDKTKRDIAILNQKLDNTVLDRGLLIQHPGDDYDLLEERILESLELRKPLVGGCGHFRSSSAGSDSNSTNCSRQPEEDYEDAVKCDDCARHVSPAILPSDEHDRVRRWDVRVYAANGLMRAGAWSAAWREMEKVDVEVGVWIPDDMKCRLEQLACHDEQEQEQFESKQPTPNMQSHTHNRHASDSTQVQHPSRERASVTSPASKATTSRSGSMATVSVSDQSAIHGASSRSEHVKPPISQPGHAGKLPMSTLLYNHFLRVVTKHSEALLASIIVLLAVWLGVRTLPSSPDQSPSGAVVLENSNRSGHAGASAALAASVASEPKVATITATTTVVKSPDVDSLLLAACTFPPGALDGQDAEMTAVPRSAAAAVLAGMALQPPQPDTSPSSSGAGADTEGAGPATKSDAVRRQIEEDVGTAAVQAAGTISEGAGRRQDGLDHAHVGADWQDAAKMEADERSGLVAASASQSVGATGEEDGR